MSWRTVVISSRCKLDTKMGYMVVRGEEVRRIFLFMELVREFDRDKLFVIVGLRSFFSDGRVGAFLKTASDHGYRILLLDCIAREKLPGERRLTIDIDLCEF